MHLLLVPQAFLLALSSLGLASEIPMLDQSEVHSPHLVAAYDKLAPAIRVKLSPDNTCGNKGAGKNLGFACDANKEAGGPCCSYWGFCGSQAKFCNVNNGCQMEFGMCRNGSVIVSPGYSSNATRPQLAVNRCGKEVNQSCPYPLCCSMTGYCGSTGDYCRVPDNCQEDWGYCDSKAWPLGHNTGIDVRQIKKGLAQESKLTKCIKPNTVALSFDDGPSSYTEQLLDLLKRYEAKATFFVLGNANRDGPLDATSWRRNALQRMVREHHQVGSHTWSHVNLSQASTQRRKDEMTKNEMAIRNAIGGYPQYMRPPYGQCSNESGCMDDMHSLGYHVMGWSYDSGDSNMFFNVSEAIKRVDNLFDSFQRDDSTLILMHDRNHESTANLTEHILKTAKSKDKTVVTIGECMVDEEKNWYRKSSKNDKLGELPSDAPAYIARSDAEQEPPRALRSMICVILVLFSMHAG